MKKIRSNDDLLELQNVALKIIPRVRFRPSIIHELNLLTHRFFAVSHIVKGQHPSGYLKCNQYVNDQDDKTCFRFIVTICSVLKKGKILYQKPLTMMLTKGTVLFWNPPSIRMVIAIKKTLIYPKDV